MNFEAALRRLTWLLYQSIASVVSKSKEPNDRLFTVASQLELFVFLPLK